MNSISYIQKWGTQESASPRAPQGPAFISQKEELKQKCLALHVTHQHGSGVFKEVKEADAEPAKARASLNACFPFLLHHSQTLTPSLINTLLA